jgi:hypothetical protein
MPIAKSFLSDLGVAVSNIETGEPRAGWETCGGSCAAWDAAACCSLICLITFDPSRCGLEAMQGHPDFIYGPI